MAGRNYGIDFGTGNIKLLCETNGNILNEKNIVAIKNKAEIFAFGDNAYEIFEKTPYNIRTVAPVKYGVISDIKNMEILFENYFKKLNKAKAVKGANFYIAVPTDVTNVEKRAFYGLVNGSKIKSRKIFYVEKPIADAVGSGIDVKNTNGCMIVNIGADTTEVSVLSSGGIIVSKIIKCGGNDFDFAICQKIESHYKINIGKKTAEQLKIKLANLGENEISTVNIYGQSTITGIPVETTINSQLINEALMNLLKDIFSQVKSILERTPPEISSDIYKNGIYLTGGSSNIKNIDNMLSEHMGIKIIKVLAPTETAVRGLKIIMSEGKFSKLKYSPKRKK